MTSLGLRLLGHGVGVVVSYGQVVDICLAHPCLVLIPRILST